MEKLTIEEAYQTILHDLDRLTENVLLLREACVQSKKVTLEDVLEFLKSQSPKHVPVVPSEIRGRTATTVIVDDPMDDTTPMDSEIVEDAFEKVARKRGYTKKPVTLAGIEHVRSFPRDIYTDVDIARLTGYSATTVARVFAGGFDEKFGIGREA